MKKLFLGICYWLMSYAAISQSISGKVTDATTGEPVAAATVSLDQGTATVTGTNGQFSFKHLKAGAYQVTISSVGYRSVTQSMATGSPAQAITLQRWNLFMQPVEVKALRAGEKAPFAKTDMTKEAIEQRNLGQDIPFLLNQTPSTVVNSDAGNGVGYTAIRIRGTDGTRINVTLNGIPYNDAESQGSYFVDLPDFSSSLNSIQIQRGVGTSSNGAGAFGATLNMSTNEVNTEPYAEVNNSYGSFNTWKNTVKAGSGLINGHFTIDARLSKVKSDGFIDRAGSDLRSFYLSGAYLSPRSSIRFNVFSGKETTYQAWNGIPEAKLNNDMDALLNHYYNNLGVLYFTPQDSVNLFNSDPRKYNYFTYKDQTDNYQQDHYQLFLNHSFKSGLTANTAFFLSRGKGYYEEYKPGAAYSDYGLPDFVTGDDTLYTTDLVRRLWLDNYYYGQIFSLQYQGTNNRFTLGGGWNRYDGDHYGDIVWASNGGIPKDDRWYSLEAYKTDVNVYGKYEQQLGERFNLFADLQYRRVLYHIGGFRDNPDITIHNLYNFINPKLGISYSHKGYFAYASYALSNKEPNRSDFEAGMDQQPKAEHLHDIELGLQYKQAAYSWGVNVYYMRYKDQLVLTGQINDVGSYTRTNIPNSYRMGVELQGQAALNRWFNITGNLTLSNNRIEDFTEYYDDYDNGGQKAIDHGTTDIAFSPSLTGSLALNFMPVKNFMISLPAKYVSRQYLDNTSNEARSLDPYYVQNLQLNYTIRKLYFKETRFIVQVNNVFNKEYQPNGYTYSYQYGGSLITENFYYPMAGINFMVGLNVKL